MVSADLVSWALGVRQLLHRCHPARSGLADPPGVVGGWCSPVGDMSGDAVAVGGVAGVIDWTAVGSRWWVGRWRLNADRERLLRLKKDGERGSGCAPDTVAGRGAAAARAGGACSGCEGGSGRSCWSARGCASWVAGGEGVMTAIEGAGTLHPVLLFPLLLLLLFLSANLKLALPRNERAPYPPTPLPATTAGNHRAAPAAQAPSGARRASCGCGCVTYRACAVSCWLGMGEGSGVRMGVCMGGAVWLLSAIMNRNSAVRTAPSLSVELTSATVVPALLCSSRGSRVCAREKEGYLSLPCRRADSRSDADGGVACCTAWSTALD
ncbi:hypothetical protein CALVIDRAFT_433906 [Calocera viscosa TUFC12733]|uniref:Uncharacterized protein n=1 Tax=Calocera viscosa (strain TUFC12733) TaxID=1330018 RepID=A0A167FX11_CALVF|nr:hypothetical protein CALVIDRAFT_433906 [Calocera viscosa TUFC12733]